MTKNRKYLDLDIFGRIPEDALFPFEFSLTNGRTVTLHQTKQAQSLGGWVYEGAACLAKYMETPHFTANHMGGGLEGKSLIELGAGTAIISIVAGCHGCESIATDLEPLLPLTAFNISNNESDFRAKVTAQTLKWGDDVSNWTTPDILALPNCVYYESSLEMLLKTVQDLSGKSTLILAAYEVRTRDIKKLISKWHALVEPFYSVVDIPRSSYEEHEFARDFVRLVVMKRKT